MRVVKKTIILGVSSIALLFFTPLDIAHSLWAKFVLGQDATISASFIEEAYAVVLSTVEDALKTLLPDAQKIKEEVKVLTEEQKKRIEKEAKIKFDPKLDKEFHFYIGSAGGRIVGYAVKNTVKGKWGPIHYMLSLEPDGRIKDAMVLQYKEKRGRPVAKRRFLNQFVGKTINDRIKLKKDIRGISGATISSRGMTNGIRKLVYVFNEFYAQKQ
jgi:Na+-translocating ferredoxin:NAD+ oxidoreductase RnfG subunit